VFCPAERTIQWGLVPSTFSDRPFQNTWIFKVIMKGFFFSDGVNYFQNSGHRTIKKSTMKLSLNSTAT